MTRIYFYNHVLWDDDDSTQWNRQLACEYYIDVCQAKMSKCYLLSHTKNACTKRKKRNKRTREKHLPSEYGTIIIIITVIVFLFLYPPHSLSFFFLEFWRINVLEVILILAPTYSTLFKWIHGTRLYTIYTHILYGLCCRKCFELWNYGCYTLFVDSCSVYIYTIIEQTTQNKLHSIHHLVYLRIYRYGNGVWDLYMPMHAFYACSPMYNECWAYQDK